MVMWANEETKRRGHLLSLGNSSRLTQKEGGTITSEQSLLSNGVPLLLKKQKGSRCQK